ncbi:MAG: PAS domain S-box protein [Desulfomonilaceae bacterium]
MQDEAKTKSQLIDELNEMRRKVAELETAQAAAMDTENAPLSYQSLDENGYFLAVNHAWLDTLGYSREEVIGKWFGDFLAPGYQEHFKINFPRFKAAGEIHGVEFEMVRRDGSIISVAFEGQIARDQWGGFKQTHCILHDITDRKRAEEELRESEEKYRSLFNNAEIGMFRTRLDGSEILDFNDQFLKIFNRTREEIKGNPSVIHWAYQHEREEMVRRLNTYGSVSDFECRILNAQGEERTCVTSLRLYPEQVVLEGSIMDITDRKRAEESLKETSAFLDTLLEAIPLPIFYKDTDGMFVGFNKSFEEFYGKPSRELVGKSVFDVYPEELAKVYYAKDNELFQNPGVQVYNTPIQDGRGVVHDIIFHKSTYSDSQGHVLGLIGVILDITERKRAEDALRKSEENYRLLAENTLDVIWQMDLDLRFTYVNRAILQVTGYTQDQWIGTRLADHCDEENFRKMAQVVSEEISKGADSWGAIIEAEMLKKNRQPFSVEIYGKIIFGENGLPMALQGITRDITERKLAETAMRERERHFRSLLETIPDALVVYDNRGKVTFTNKAFERFFGWSMEELAGKPLENFVPPSEEAITKQSWERTLQGENVVFETQRWTKDGKVLDLQMSTAILRNMNGELTASIVIHRDITAKKRAEEELHSSEQKYRQIFDYSPLGILHFDYGGTITACNDNFVQIIGSSREKLVGLNMINDLKDVQIVAAVKRTLSGETGHYEGKYASVTADKVTWVKVDFSPLLDERGVVLGGIGITEDITATRKAEETQRRLATAIDQATEGVVITDPKGTIHYVNPAISKITGYSPQELIGANPRILKSGEHDSTFYRQLWDTIKSGATWSGRFINRKKKGRLYYEDATISPVKDTSGKITNFVAVKRDVTERLELSKQLFQAQKMEAVGTLAGGIAHDFNNLLQAVLGYSELMLQRKKDGEADYADLQKIFQAGKRGADLVKSLLAFSRKVETKYVPVDLNDEIISVRSLLSRTIPKTIRIDLRLSGDLESIRGDSSQIGQVLMNLGVNARDAMPDGGTLTFETTNVQLDKEYCSSHLEAMPGSYVLLTVSDTGQGMDKETLSHIFEPFYTTKETGKGTGLGLATVYGIVKQHGGHITCYSEPGNGATFKIYFPTIQREQDMEAPTFETVIPGGTETVLLVDDEDLLRELGARILNQYGYNVITASNGKEALEIYQMDKDRISLVILDLIMPEMDGKKCLEEILLVNPNAKVVLASGHSEGRASSGAMASRAKGFVQKPYDMRQLLNTIREILDKD